MMGSSGDGEHCSEVWFVSSWDQVSAIQVGRASDI